MRSIFRVWEEIGRPSATLTENTRLADTILKLIDDPQYIAKLERERDLAQELLRDAEKQLVELYGAKPGQKTEVEKRREL